MLSRIVNRIVVLKAMDSLVGRIVTKLALLVPLNRSVPAENVKSVLIIRPGGIGDAALLAPAIRSFKNMYPSSHIRILAERRNEGVFSLISEVDDVLCYDRPGELLQALRGCYDAVMDTEQSHRLSAVVARFSSAPVKIGFATNNRHRMFTHRIFYSHDDYEAVSFTHLLEPLSIEAGRGDMRVPFLSVPGSAISTAAGLLASLHDEPYVTLFPGASIPERRWGADRFRLVAEAVAASNIRIVVVGGNDDRQQGELISGKGLGLNLAGVTSLPETAAVIQKSALLLSADSGLLHIAVGLGVPTVSLFGSGRAKKWAPQGGRHIVINKELSCSPCTTFGTTPACPIDARCMREITVEEVVDAAAALLTGPAINPFVAAGVAPCQHTSVHPPP